MTDNKNNNDIEEVSDDLFFDTEEGLADETIKDDLLADRSQEPEPEKDITYYDTKQENVDKQGKNDLMRAAEEGDYAKVKDLIKKGYALTSQDKDGNTALMLACKNNHFDVARVIIDAIEAKIDKNTSAQQYTKNLRKQSEYLQIVNKKGENALSLAVMPNFVSAIYTLLEDKGAVLPTQAGKALERTIELARKKLEDEIESQKHLSSNTTSKTALEVANSEIPTLQEKLAAVEQMKLENINTLQVEKIDLKIAKEAVNINFQDEKGKTALMRAIEARDDILFEKMMKSDHNLNLQDNEGNTALMLASEAKDSKVFNRLLFLAATNLSMQLNLQDKDGKTLLMKAAEKEDVSFVKSVISAIKSEKHEAAFTAQDRDGNTALMLACANNNLKMVKALSEGQKPEYFNMRNKKGRSAYSMTINSEIREILKANGANITLTDRMGEVLQREAIKSPIEIAVEKSDTKYIKENIKSVLEFKNKDGDTALILASRANNLSMVQQIVEGIVESKDKKEYINRSNNKGENALSIQDFSADVDDNIAQYLTKEGALKLGLNYVKQQQYQKNAPKQAFTSRLSAVEKGYKTDLGKIKDQLQKKQFKNELKAEQKKLGKQIFQDRLNKIFGGEVSDNTRDELREMQKMLGRVKRSDQVTGVVDRVINKFSNKKGRTQ